ncbi:MAG: hypothetical protein PHW40_03400 [Candidatus Izemoplasmatales bacterium]|nr:hypothetical protein [Candidatus Izemoplasmatales bacterium]MDD5293340.1 hypothetical protein [Candidatus Izemoplasmatales bacterium]
MSTVRIFINHSIRMIFKDPMLILLLVCPLLIAFVFKAGNEILAPVLMDAYAFDLSPYHAFIDFFVLFLGSMMMGVVTSFVLIDENDEGVSRYYEITPLGKKRYLMYRIGIPWMIYTIEFCLISVFGLLVRPSFGEIFLRYLFAISQLLFCGLLVLALAKNKLEALVVAKLVGLMVVPLIVPLFIEAPITYALIPFPGFWLGKGLLLEADDYLLYALIMGTMLSLCYAWVLYRRAFRS